MRLRRSSALSFHEMRQRALATRSSKLIVASQIRQVPSSEAEATRLPSGDQDTHLTVLVWAPTITISVPDSTSQIRTVRSPDPVTNRCPSGDQATAVTLLSWPRSTASSPPSVSQIRAVRRDPWPTVHRPVTRPRSAPNRRCCAVLRVRGRSWRSRFGSCGRSTW